MTVMFPSGGKCRQERGGPALTKDTYSLNAAEVPARNQAQPQCQPPTSPPEGSVHLHVACLQRGEGGGVSGGTVVTTRPDRAFFSLGWLVGLSLEHHPACEPPGSEPLCMGLFFLDLSSFGALGLGQRTLPILVY